MIFMVGWDLLWVFGSPSIVSRAAAFLGFFSFLWFSFFFLLFSLSLSFQHSNMNCCTVSSVEPSDTFQPGPQVKRKGNNKSKPWLGVLGLVLKRTSGRLQVLMMMIMMLSPRVFCLFSFIFIFYFFLLLPMMIRVVRVRPEGRVLQPVCFLWVCDG